MPAVPVLPVAQDQSLHRDPRHAGPGPDAGRHLALLAATARRCTTTWAPRPSRTTPCCRRSRWRKSARTRRSTRSATSAAASPPASARCINTAKVEHGAKAIVFGLGGIGLNVLQGLRLAGADMIIGVDINNDRKAWGERFGMTHFVNPKELGKDLVPHLVNMTKSRRRPDRRRRLHLRLHRQRHGDAAGAGSLPSRLGPVDRHRRRARRRGDRDAAVPAGDRPRLERHRVRRRARPHRRAEDRRLVHGRQDRDRPDDHPRDAAGRHQQGVRPDEARRSRSAAW